MKEARYLIRISHPGVYQPAAQAQLLSEARQLAGPLNGKAINLRVTPVAIEFDLFCDADVSVDPFLSAFENIGRVITCKRLDLPTATPEANVAITEARALFNEHRFWEVHEVLEGLWKSVEGPEKQLVQGLILAAAALVHAQKDESSVLWSMLADAGTRLKDQPPRYHGWDIGKFRDHLARMLASKKLEIPTV
jgi:hypothetical protein